MPGGKFTSCSIYFKADLIREHIFRDLRPYVCTYTDCNSGDQLYDSWKDWITHERWAHNKIWCCPTHPSEKFNSALSFKQHLQDDCYQTLPEAELDRLVSANETFSNDVTQGCPFCLCNIEDAHKFQNHIATHLQRIALFALPRSINIEDASEAGSFSSKANVVGNTSQNLGSRGGLDDINWGDEETNYLNDQHSENILSPAETFIKVAEVAYKRSQMQDDGSQWILCNVTNILDDGNKKLYVSPFICMESVTCLTIPKPHRYEVQDHESYQDNGLSQFYEASATDLIAIPPPNAFLPEYPIDKPVLALYPDATFFYYAKVTGMRENVCQVEFLEEQGHKMEIDRRFLLHQINDKDTIDGMYESGKSLCAHSKFTEAKEILQYACKMAESV